MEAPNNLKHAMISQESCKRGVFLDHFLFLSPTFKADCSNGLLRLIDPYLEFAHVFGSYSIPNVSGMINEE